MGFARAAEHAPGRGHDRGAEPAGRQPRVVDGRHGRLTGAELARRLCAQGVAVRALARASSRLEPLADLPIEWVRVIVFDPAVVAAAARDVAYIFHVAAAYRQAGLADEVYRKVHVESTRSSWPRPPSASRGSGGLSTCRRSACTGTSSTRRPTKRRRFIPATFTSRPRPRRSYGCTGSRRSGAPATVIRPAAIYGPGDRRLLKVFRMRGRRLFCWAAANACTT